MTQLTPQDNKYPIGGFAPGNYSNKCATCGKSFMGDKMARQCEPCAIEMVGEDELLKIVYEEATLKNLGSNPQGTRMDIIYLAMKMYAAQQSQQAWEQGCRKTIIELEKELALFVPVPILKKIEKFPIPPYPGADSLLVDREKKEIEKMADNTFAASEAILFGEFLLENNMSPDGFGGWGGGSINTNLYGNKTEQIYNKFKNTLTQ